MIIIFFSSHSIFSLFKFSYMKHSTLCALFLHQRRRIKQNYVTVKHGCFNQTTRSTTFKVDINKCMEIIYMRLRCHIYDSFFPASSSVQASVMLSQNINLRCCFCVHSSNSKAIRMKAKRKEKFTKLRNQNICRLFNVFIFTSDHFSFAQDNHICKTTPNF